MWEIEGLTQISVSLWMVFNLLILAMVANTFACIFSIFLPSSLTTVSNDLTDLHHSLLLWLFQVSLCDLHRCDSWLYHCASFCSLFSPPASLLFLTAVVFLPRLCASVIFHITGLISLSNELLSCLPALSWWRWRELYLFSHRTLGNII